MTDETAPSQKPRGAAWLAVPLLFFLAMAGLFGYALTSGSDPSKLPSTLIGKPAPATAFPALEGLIGADGKPTPGFTSADLAGGDVKVVNFWASWCAPCIEEHPLLLELKQKAGVQLYGVNYKDQTEAARRFIGRFGNPFTAMGTDTTGRNAIEWGLYGTPETFVVNGKGEIVFKHVGPVSKESLEKQLLPAIAAARSGK